MDTGYPALITEPLATPGDPKTAKSQGAVSGTETQADPSNPESSGSPANTTPLP